MQTLLGGGRQVKMNKKLLGVVRKDKTFMVFREEKKHFFRLFDGWGMNEELLKELNDAGMLKIEIHCSDTKNIYITDMASFFNHGIPYKNPKKEKDSQMILPKSFFVKFNTRD